MKTIFISVILSFLISNCTYSQELVWGQDKDRIMSKIEKIINDIDNDKSLIRFRINDSLTKAEIDTTKNGDNIENVSFQTELNMISPNYYYLKDSVVVKLIYDGQTFYFLDENLIMSYKRYEGFSDNTTQCCPITIGLYHYYWKSTYYKSYKKSDSNCTNPCSIVISSANTQAIDLLMKKIKTFANKK